MTPANQSDEVRRQALAALTQAFAAQGHPAEYAAHMATATIFQTDLELRNAQLNRLLAWLKQEHETLYPLALQVVEGTREEFEQRVRIG